MKKQYSTVSTLTEEEIKFFNDTVARIKYSVNVNVPIEPMDHEQLIRKYKEALGICWAEDNGEGRPAPFKITIDEFFIHECYVALKDPYAVFVPDTLEHVIAHEIAHLHVWRHGKKHTELTQRICRLIEKGEPHGMENSGAAPTKEPAQVAMAAMQPTRKMKKQYSIPDEIVNATVRVLQNYQQRLEKEVKVLVRASATPAQMDEHRKLTLLVHRLESFYSEIEDAATMFRVSWDNREGNRRNLQFSSLQDALLEAAELYKSYDHIEIELI